MNGDTFAPGEMARVIDSPYLDKPDERRMLGRTVIVWGEHPGPRPPLLPKFYPLYRISGIPPYKLASHLVLEKIPPAPMDYEFEKEDEPCPSEA